MKTIKSPLVAVVLLLGLCGAASAQRDVAIERFVPPVDADGFLGVQGSRTPGHGRYTLGLYSGYELAPLRFDLIDGSEIAPVEHRVSGELSAEFGLGGRAALAASVPLVLYQTGDVSAIAATPDSFALADPRVLARYRFLGRAESKDNEHRDGPGLALQVSSWLPIGSEQAYAGEGAVRLRAELIGDFHVLGAGVGATVGVLHRFAPRQLLDRRLRDELVFGAALRLPILPLSPLAGVFEVRGSTDFGSAATTAVELMLGGMLPLGTVSFSLGGGLGVTGGLGEPDARIVLAAFYRPASSDTDGDGLADDEDGCPPLPEDRDGFQDDDGCPDPDNDNDLIPDVDDLCPNEEALENRDEDEDGCTDPP